MAIYLKLGKKAESFSDPISRLTVSGKQVVMVTTEQTKSLKTNNAIKNGHLVRTSQSEYKKWIKYDKDLREGISTPSSNKDSDKEIRALRDKIDTLQVENNELKMKLDEASSKGSEGEDEPELIDFDELGEDELIKFYTENYEVDEKQVKAFKKLPVEKMREELEALSVTSESEE